MAISSAKTVESVDFKRYFGIAPVKVVAVNPSKAELEKIYGREIEKDPVYVNTVKQTDGTEVQQIRINVVVKTVKDSNNDVEDLIVTIPFFINRAGRVSKSNKYQVVDAYGNFGWATQEEIDSHAQLKSSTGKNLKIATNYRKAYQGEEALTDFIRVLYNLNAFDYNQNTGEFTLKEDASNNECRLDNIQEYFKGNVSEVKETLVGCANTIKVLFGVRKTEDGKLFQTVFTGAFMSANSRNSTSLINEVNTAKENGRYSDTEFDLNLGLKEYVVDTTKFLNTPEKPQESKEELPF